MPPTLATESDPAASSYTAPISLEQVTHFLEIVGEGKLTFELGLRSDSFPLVCVPDRTSLHFEATFTNGLVDPEKTRLWFGDELGRRVSLRGIAWSVNFSELKLCEIKATPHAGAQARLVAFGRAFFMPWQMILVPDLPLHVSALLEKLESMTVSHVGSSISAAGEPISPASAADPSRFRTNDCRYDVSFTLTAGATLVLNEGTSVSVDSGGNATVSIKGVHDYTVATITGERLLLDTTLLSTEASDIDVRVTLNGKPGGMHIIAFNHSNLHGVQFKSSEFSAPTIETLYIDATDYDFVITINPDDKFTLQMLLAKIIEQVGHPELLRKLRQKLLEKTEEAGSSSSSMPSETVLDSALWNIVDYVAHDFKGVFGHVKDLPHIREYLDDSALQNIVREGVRHL